MDPWSPMGITSGLISSVQTCPCMCLKDGTASLATLRALYMCEMLSWAQMRCPAATGAPMGSGCRDQWRYSAQLCLCT